MLNMKLSEGSEYYQKIYNEFPTITILKDNEWCLYFMYWIVNYYLTHINGSSKGISYYNLVKDIILEYFKGVSLSEKQQNTINKFYIPDFLQTTISKYIQPEIKKIYERPRIDYSIKIDNKKLEELYTQKGIYIFWNKTRCLYVGKSMHLGSRVISHLGNKDFKRWMTDLHLYFIETMTQTDIYEIIAINYLKPIFNKISKYKEPIIYKFNKKPDLHLEIKVSKEKEIQPDTNNFFEDWSFGYKKDKNEN